MGLNDTANNIIIEGSYNVFLTTYVINRIGQKIHDSQAIKMINSKRDIKIQKLAEFPMPWILFLLIMLFYSPFINAQHPLKLELVKDINLGGDSSPSNFFAIDGKIIFAADDGVHGRELWVTDGTNQGTYMVKDINPNGDGIVFRIYSALGKVFFTADDGVNGVELWMSDGTNQGTHMVKEINTGSDPYGEISHNSSINIWSEYNNELYFSANDSVHGVEVWKTDGTSNGTVLLKDINPEAFNFNQLQLPIPTGGVVYKNKFYFMASDSIHGFELWHTDGTELGTKMLKDINPNGDGGGVYLYEYKNRLFFRAADTNGFELWVSDGTTNGTKLFANINQNTVGYISGSPHTFIEYQGKLYFGGTPNYSQYDNRLFYINGFDSVVYEVNIGFDIVWYFTNQYIFHDKIFYMGNTINYSAEPWVTGDGFVTNTMLKDIETTKLYPWDIINLGSTPSHYFDFQDYLIFKAQDRQDGGRQLYVYDDGKDTLQPLLPYSTHQVYNSANSFSSDHGVIVSGSSCYIVGEYDTTFGVELWRIYDSTVISVEENIPVNQSNLKVYPNPNTGNFIILELNEIFDGNIQIEMLDLSGKRIRLWEEIGTHNQNIQIPTRGLKQGVYFLKVSSRNYNETVKFVKQ